VKTNRLFLFGSFIFVFLNVSVFLTAEEIQANPAWQTIDQAYIAFERGELGLSFSLCEKARKIHIETMQDYAKKLSSAISSPAILKVGEDINLVRLKLVERKEVEAASIIDMVLRVRDESFFNKKIQNLYSWLVKRASYPEADMLCGDIYSAEGEYVLAMDHYMKAWQQSDLLTVPGERFSLCYRMADISRITGDYGAQEQFLLLVLTEDPVFGKPGKESSTLLGMKRTLESTTDGEKFYSLYRHRNSVALKAYQDLSVYYYVRSGKRLDSALSVATLAAVISITMLDDFLLQKNIDYEYASFTDTLTQSAKFPDILEEASRLKFWDSFIIFAEILYDQGKTTIAEGMISDLVYSCPDSSKTVKAQGLLKRMMTETR